MTYLHLTIDADGAAFTNEAADEHDERAHRAARANEAARLLRATADRIESEPGRIDGPGFDHNGNHVMQWEWVESGKPMPALTDEERRRIAEALLNDVDDADPAAVRAARALADKVQAR